MSNLNKDILIRLDIDETDAIKALEKINIELEVVQKKLNSAKRIDLGPLSKELADLQELKQQFELLSKQQAKTTQTIQTNTVASTKATQAAIQATKNQEKAIREGEKYLAQQKKSAEAVANAFLSVAKATITIITTYEQFGVATEDQGRLLTKLFQVMGLLQSAQEVYNVALTVNTAITEANALAKTENAIATGALAVNTTAATASTSLLTKALASLGLVGTGVLGLVAGLGAAYFVFSKNAEDVRIENEKLFQSYEKNYLALTEQIDAQLELNKLQNPDKFAAEQKFLELTNKVADVRIKLLFEEKESYQRQIQSITDATKATLAYSQALQQIVEVPARDFTLAESKQIQDFGANIDKIQKEIDKNTKLSIDSAKKLIENQANKEAELANLRLANQIEQLSLNTDIESVRNSALLSLQQEINLNTAKLKIDKDDQAAQLESIVLQSKARNIEIEYQRSKRLLLLEEFKIQAETDRAKTNQLNNIESKLLSATTDRIIAQTELNTAIANGLPAEEAIVKQKELELQYNNSIYAVQLEINDALLASQKTIEDTNYQSLIDQLAVPTGNLAQDLENKLKSAAEVSAKAIIDIQNDINEKILAANGSPELIKQLELEKKLRIKAEQDKAKITEDIIKKSNSVALAQEQLKEFQIRELQATTLKTELANINTTFTRRKEINEELLKLQIERIRLQEELDLKSATTDAEKQRIKETADFAIKEAERVTSEVIQKDSIISKLFGTPKEVDQFINGTKAVAKSLQAISNEFESTSKIGDIFKAIGGSLSEVVGLAGTLVETIKGFNKDTTLEEKTAAITALVGESLNSITNLITESLNTTLDRQIETIDTTLDELKDKKDLIDQDLADSIDRIKGLEANLAEAREGDRGRIIALIDQERAREQKLAQDKQKYFDQEQVLEAKRKELQKKQFENQKFASVIQATINTAVGVTAALAIPPPAGQILAGITGALGALQIATIIGQPIPEFRTGGFTPADRDDSKPVGVVHANEYVLSAPIVRSPRFKPLIEEAERFRMNGYQSGGLVVPNEQPNDTLQRTLDTAIALSERPIFVQVTAIEDAIEEKNNLAKLVVL